ncbi:MAG: hypothetical protein R3E32_19710 [Chitinophagales bacterium]
MPIDYKDIDIIQDYLEGNLDKNSLTKFEEELAVNTALAEQVKWHETFTDAILLEEKEKLQQHVKQLIKNEKVQSSKENHTVSSVKKFRISNRHYWAAAAIVFLTFSVALLFYSNNQSSIVAEDLAVPYAAPVVTMGATKIDNQLWQQAILAYQTGEYEQVVAALTQKEQVGSLNTEQKFYLGLAYLYQNMNEPQQVVQYLEAAKQENPTLYEETCNWYIALAYLKDNQKEVAKQYLQTIVNNQSWKHQEAQELLKK